MSRKRKYLYIPIEIKKREFPAKLFLGIEAAQKGLDVIIGNATYVQTLALHSKRGVYLGTSLLKSHGILFDRLHKRGCKVVVCDEEGLVYYNKENFIKHHANIEVMNKVDSICAWGEHHKELLMRGGESNNVVVTGNVRFDMYKEEYKYLFEEKKNEYERKYGKYILINTNLAAYNSYKGKQDFEEYLLDVKKVSGVDLQDQEFYYDKFQHQKKIYEQIVQLVKEILKEFADLNIVVRPHPGENLEFWKVFEDKRVIVIREGEVVPWILGAKVVVQQNCTTGIEALVLKKPAISFIPEYDERFDGGLPNQMAKRCNTKKEIIEEIKYILERQENEISDVEKKLDFYISNLGDKSYAKKMIVNECVRCAVDEKKRINKLKSIFLQIGYDCYITLLSGKVRKKLYKEKFVGISLQEIEKKLSNSKLKDIEISKLCKDVFVISKT